MYIVISRFMAFRKVLDGEMEDATKYGVAQASKMEEKKEITEKEEAILWNKGLLGSNTAESLLHSVYFYNGKLFGLRAGEHRLLRLSNIVVKENKIIFDEFRCKTFKGGLKDLNNKPRYIEHICHEIGVSHNPCLASMYSLYIEKIQDHAQSVDSFYFRPQRNGKFAYEKSPIGLCTLNKILPDKLMQSAGLPRKTAHCLRVTCASRLFQNSVGEKLARDRTGHKSNALFGYQKPSKRQVQNVSEVLGPCTDMEISTSTKSIDFSENEAKHLDASNVSALSDDPAVVPTLLDEFPNFDFNIPDELLANIPLPETRSTANVKDMCANATFANCSINFFVNN